MDRRLLNSTYADILAQIFLHGSTDFSKLSLIKSTGYSAVNFFVSLLFSTAATGIAYHRDYLTLSAALCAFIFATIILSGSGLAMGISVGLCFFITALLSQWRGIVAKQEALHARARRDLGQVFANGIGLCLLALVDWLIPAETIVLSAALLGCIGAVAGDTWATEVGHVTQQPPRALLSAQRVAVGTPGAVTVLGTALTGLAGIVATLCFALVSWAIEGEILPTATLIRLGIAAGFGGLLGALADSLLGARFQAIYRSDAGEISDHSEGPDGVANRYIRGWRLLTNNRVNFCNSLVGALAASVLWLLMAT